MRFVRALASVIGMAVLAAGCVPAESAPDPYDAHIASLKKRLATKGLRKLVIRDEPPFVVVSNGSTEDAASGASVVRWAVSMFEKDFFAVRPGKILDIYLFRDAATYERWVKRLTGEAPTTPYGFYSRANEGLFMNISTGGGTLVHELVHPYVEVDFPDAPPWLNEGLGSLFEQSAEKDGHIIGLTNWRLSGLQSAITAGTVPAISKLTHEASGEFYGDDVGVNYAEARYLLYYLQQSGTLHTFYTTCRDNRAKDPTCTDALKKVLGTDDLDAFKTTWEAWVAKLSFP